MDITENLTNQAKGNKKSYLEVENSNIVKKRTYRDDRKQHDPNSELKLEDENIENVSSIDGDGDVVNEVTIVSENSTQDGSDDQQEIADDENKKLKNNIINKTKLIIQKKQEGEFC